MFVPFFSDRAKKSALSRRKGGGGHGDGGGGEGGGGRSGGGRSSGSASSITGSSAGKKSIVNSGGTARSASSYGNGGSNIIIIQQGQPFAGRSSGGGLRSNVYGTRRYGSGYPGSSDQCGVNGRSFPYVFWPIVWGLLLARPLYITSSEIYTNEYGGMDNSSRPGGVMLSAEITSSSPPSTFRILGDNTSITAVVVEIQGRCASITTSSIIVSAYNESTTVPKPEQAIQYYRASSFALTLDGYNNTVAINIPSQPDMPIPSNIDTALLNCLNMTIGTAVPLIDAAVMSQPSFSLILTLSSVVFLILTQIIS